MELFNCYGDPRYRDVVEERTAWLEAEMQEIGDEPAHGSRPGAGATAPH